ncbi:SCPU domain-containing protein [Altererythrobacter sp. FM1]|uniref:Spore coat protein U domain-containing protein n=1 Tax=Tsuneonella flava TaxID=2055955 RepID=A0ABX7KB21_9SPHN|nr:spore coat U domain-containing protein [Tsuneonella flava]QSB45073.1 spore coat protein U domain-containing protein [Tsuneonella flava]ROT96804.1 SCPU domain-containing protein [Altererythrobacter sp. FM1]
MRKIAIVLAASAAVVATPALAQTATGTVEVSLNVSSACSVTAEPLSFGSVTALDAAIDASSPTTVKCTPNANYTVNVGYGSNAGAGTVRKLKSSAGDEVSYALYTDATRTTEWTPTSGRTGVGNGSDQSMTIYGRVPSQAAVPAGNYTDSVVVTVTY